MGGDAITDGLCRETDRAAKRMGDAISDLVRRASPLSTELERERSARESGARGSERPRQQHSALVNLGSTSEPRDDGNGCSTMEHSMECSMGHSMEHSMERLD